MEDIDLLLAFAHTRAMTDEIGTPEQLRAWLEAHGLNVGGGEPITPDDVRRAVHLRAAIASLLRAYLGGPGDERTQPTIEDVTARAPLRVAIDADGLLVLEATGTGVDRALAEIVAALYRCKAAGTSDRLKLCKSCGHAFYDTSKNRSRIWCDMTTCGSQEKARAYRQRQSAKAE
jgi:predicted RNA-binding Zn ribbon-like protein